MQDRENVRNAAFTLFGNLARFGDGQSRDTFLEQIHSNLVSLLLHLNDPDSDVRKVMRYYGQKENNIWLLWHTFTRI